MNRLYCILLLGIATSTLAAKPKYGWLYTWEPRGLRR